LHCINGSVQAVSQQTPLAQKRPAAHCDGVAQAPPCGTGVLVGVDVTVAVCVAVDVAVTVAVAVTVGVMVGVAVCVAVCVAVTVAVAVLVCVMVGVEVGVDDGVGVPHNGRQLASQPAATSPGGHKFVWKVVSPQLPVPQTMSHADVAQRRPLKAACGTHDGDDGAPTQVIRQQRASKSARA
jgi:hypothetical protein